MKLLGTLDNPSSLYMRTAYSVLTHRNFTEDAFRDEEEYTRKNYESLPVFVFNLLLILVLPKYFKFVLYLYCSNVMLFDLPTFLFH